MSITIDEAHQPERVRYFPRQLIGADDLTQEQLYHRQKLRNHNRFLHGWGVVCGCDIQPGHDPAAPWVIRIRPGYLITPDGDEIWIPAEARFDVATCLVQSDDPCASSRPCPPVVRRALGAKTVYLAVRYVECQARPVRVGPVGCGCDDADCEYSRFVDGYEFCCLTTVPPTHTRTPYDCGRLLEARPIVPCPEPSDQGWVVLATIKMPPSTTTRITDIDPFAHRCVLYSTAAVQELARCTALRPRLTTAQYVLPMDDARLLHTIRFPDGSWLHAGDIRAVTGVAGRVRTAAATAGAPDEVQLLLAMEGGGLLHTIRSADGSWQDPAGPADLAAGITGGPAHAVAAATGVRGEVQFMVATDDDKLWHTIRFNDGTWQQAQDVSPAGLAGITGHVRAAAAAAGAAGEVQFMLPLEDGRLLHTIRFADGSWQHPAGPADLAAGISGDAHAVAAASGTPGEVQFMVATDDDKLWHTIRFADGTWLQAQEPPGGIAGRVRAAAAAAGGHGEVQFMLAMEDGRLLHTIRFPDGAWQSSVGDAESASGISGSVLVVAAASVTG